MSSVVGGFVSAGEERRGEIERVRLARAELRGVLTRGDAGENDCTIGSDIDAAAAANSKIE